ncbi:hypothetical protein V6N12_057297 [Hibiscus sabdariffa]|uniref:Uncharacterized protein n=1 Tax=Hibiscus sabdariffa TaxID=183260 RepID=A0ABR2DBI4_9ROSI
MNPPRQEYQQPNNYKTLENTLVAFMTKTSAYMARMDQFIQKTDAFMDKTDMRMQNQEAALKSLENQVGQISQVINARPMEGFPSDTEVAKSATHEQCKAITTRSGRNLQPPNKSKQWEETATNPNATIVPDDPASADAPTSVGEDHEIPLNPKEADPIAITTPQIRPPRTETLEDIRPPPPFPQRLKKQKQEHSNKCPTMPSFSRTWCLEKPE